MRREISAYIREVINWVIYLLVGLTPLIFAPFTTEYFDTPKIIFLIAGLLVLLVLWPLSWIVQGKVVLTRTPLDIPLILFLAVIILSSIFSDSRPVAILGSLPRIHGSAVSLIAYILFYFVLVSNIRTLRQVKILIYILLGSASLAATVSLLSYFGLYIPLPYTQSPAFTPTGSAFSTTAMLVLLLPLVLSSIMVPASEQIDYSKLADRPYDFAKNYFRTFLSSRFLLPLPIALVLAALFGVTIALTGSLATQVGAALAVALILFISRKKQLDESLPSLSIPVGVSLLLFIWGLVSVNNPTDPIGAKFASFPKEIQIPFVASWKVSASAFRDSPFLGTGPATYLFNYTAYKPVEINADKNLWNLRFDQAFNEYFQILASLGGLGLLAFLFFAAMTLAIAWRDTVSIDNHNLTLPLSLGAILLLVLMAFHTSTPTFMVVGFSLLAMLMAIHKTITGKVEELSLGIKASSLTDSNLIIGDILPIILFIPIIVFVLIVAWNAAKIVYADYHHRLALNLASTNGIATYNNLVQAESLNPYSDLYRTDLAQTNFALANAIATNKAPSEASPGGSLTDQDRANIQTLLSQAITEAKNATVLSPRSSINWEVLASIYRQISGVAQNALVFSLDAYGRAIQRDPLNPLLRLNVGGVYYSARNYELATRFFTDAIVIKPDYANGYYNLSVALRDKGDLQGSLAAAQRMLQLIDPKSQDYKVATDYINDLQKKISGESGEETKTEVPPAAAENAPLQKKELPKVVELGKPENIATPPALQRKGNQVVEASPTPTPSPTP